MQPAITNGMNPAFGWPSAIVVAMLDVHADVSGF